MIHGLDTGFEEILKDPDLAGILQKYAEHGPVMKEKLLKHLAFIVDNRREYYSACPA